MASQTLDGPTPAAQAAELTPVGALTGVLLWPRRTFERLREAERGHWWLVFVLALIVLVFNTVATVPVQVAVQQAVFEEQMGQLGDLPPEQQAQIEQTQRIFSSTAMLSAIGTLTGIVGLVLGYAVRAGVLFLLGLALGGHASFKQVWRMAVWATLPLVIGNLVGAVVVLATGQFPAAGLTYIYTDAELASVSPIVQSILGSIDLYVVWSLVLIAVGMAATARLSRAKSAGVAAAFWLLGTGLSAALAAAGQAVARAFGGG